MPKLSWSDIISSTTEKSIRNSLIFSSIAILSKFYDISFKDFNVFWINIPESLVDTTLFILILCFSYWLIIKWLWDLSWFKLWYNSNSILSEFWTEMKLDKTFINWWVSLLKKLHELEIKETWPNWYENLDEDTKNKHTDFKTNIELFILRLEHAWTKFNTLSFYARYYVFVQSFLIPILINILAIYLIIYYWNLLSPWE
jgi:hypothetical protein